MRRLFRDIVPQLLRYRFLREVPRERESEELLAPERCVYECLAGLHTYDVRALSDEVLRDLLAGRWPEGDVADGEKAS